MFRSTFLLFLLIACSKNISPPAESDFIAVDDLRDQLNPPPPNNSPDRPSVYVCKASQYAGHGVKASRSGITSIWPRLDEPAPIFALKTLPGESTTLSEQIGEKPVVLIFGNFTCGPFRSQAGDLEKFYHRHRNSANN